ncbi:flagellar biosynthesis protein FlhF [Texcoconibacillus texcoconensis]|uniref:Flagellar biosynthesis protein FlhF n=1 Tax=Texcoconibacillus texcoconensis TaxID=1095777 RepID=A0A840QIS7_9BACI|nr:flagellar biosynthesis protein FlhF [Texcoconibacillus texcoconensis]MBB5172059.1 flagellar biosynthesis protein FlhF [Texcoconibacillus texcoconensis]
MKVKKFLAKDMPEAMKKVRSELGDDAVILNSKNVETGGFLGFFTKKNIEVIAAIDPHQLSDAKRSQKKENQGYNQTNKYTNKQTNVSETRTKPPKRPEPPKAQEKFQTANLQKKDSEYELKKEIEDLKGLVQKMSGTSTPNEGYPPPLEAVNRRLKDQEVIDTIRYQVMKDLLRFYYTSGETSEESTVKEWAENALKDVLPNVTFGGINFDKRFLNVVGPTGVGKTTTLAKIAAHASLNDNKSVAFITTDTYRIAAVEQLKTYAKILNVPVEVAYSIDDFKKAKEKLSGYDVILVDSAGRNFRNPLYVEQLSQVIDFDNEMETHLVLALTSKYRDMSKIIEQFQLIDIDKLILTKEDETDTSGAALNLVCDYQIGISYMTDGQNVPDDMSEATADSLVQKVVRG